MGILSHGQVLLQNYLQTPTSFSSNSKSSFESGRKKTRSTKTFPTKENHHHTRNIRHKTVFFTLATKEYGKTYSYLNVIYPIIYIPINQYIFMCYGYDTNIQVIPTKTRNAVEIRDATMSMLSILNTSGHQPNLHILDNEK